MEKSPIFSRNSACWGASLKCLYVSARDLGNRHEDLCAVAGLRSHWDLVGMAPRTGVLQRRDTGSYDVGVQEGKQHRHNSTWRNRAWASSLGGSPGHCWVSRGCALHTFLCPMQTSPAGMERLHSKEVISGAGATGASAFGPAPLPIKNSKTSTPPRYWNG